jgi:hypothetical protein
VGPNAAPSGSVIEQTDPGILIAGVRITGFELACRAAPCCPALGILSRLVNGKSITKGEFFHKKRPDVTGLIFSVCCVRLLADGSS